MNRKEMLSLLGMGFLPAMLSENFAVNTRISVKKTSKPVAFFKDGRDWFRKKHFGMFVHWGIYSIPAWHEQYQQRKNIPRKEYIKYADQFNPKKFNPSEWLDIMQEAGMEYITITTKHHDGFCMWDTKETKFNIMNTPYKKDIIGMLVQECHKRKVPVCFYYSVADWNHPNYPNLGRHHELSKPEEGDSPDWNKYKEFVKRQVTELCTNYGGIQGFWWDMNVPQDYDRSVNDIIRKLQPGAVINNRGFDEGDFHVNERDYDDKPVKGKVSPMKEACQSLDDTSWGYNKDPEYFSDGYLMKSIDRYISANSNYLLNVGPTAEGIIPPASVEILKRIGKWMKLIKPSLYNVENITPSFEDKSVSYTSRGNILFIHFNKNAFVDGLWLKPIKVLPIKATILNNSAPVRCVVTRVAGEEKEKFDYLRLKNLPVNEMANTAMVVRLQFDRNIKELI